MSTKFAIITAAERWKDQCVRIAQYQGMSRGSPVILKLMREQEIKLHGEFLQALEALCQDVSTQDVTS